MYPHYSDVIISTMASQITSVSTVYSTVCSGSDRRKHQSSASLAFVRGILRWPVNSPLKGPVTRKMLPFDDVIIHNTTTITGHPSINHHHHRHRHHHPNPPTHPPTHSYPPIIHHPLASKQSIIIISSVSSTSMPHNQCQSTQLWGLQHLWLANEISLPAHRRVSNWPEPGQRGAVGVCLTHIDQHATELTQCYNLHAWSCLQFTI